jgi:iron complex transport system substrate-binding protein
MKHRLVGGIAAVLLLLAACGESTAPAAPSGTPTDSVQEVHYPVTIETEAGPFTIESRPDRIVSLSPTATEMLFEIGAGDQVVAVDDQSSYPEDAPVTDLSGYEPNVEAIASYDPDLVVYATETGDLGASLGVIGIPALLQPAAAKLQDVYDQIEQLGVVTNHVTEAEEITDGMRADIDAVLAGVEDRGTETTFYHELDDTYYSVTSETFIGQLYEMVGLDNIADEAKGAGGGYPQLSAEYIIDADPDLIFLADTKCCGQSAVTVSERPGWDRITAVERGDVIALDDDVASRWGPRVVDHLERILDAVHEAEAEAA